MKFIRYGEKGKEHPGVLDPLGRIRDISHLVPDIGGSVLAQLGRFNELDLNSLPLVDGDPRIGQCIGGVGKIICDIISTGTPPGVGLGQSPPVYLKPGQTMRVGIEKLGEQLQKTVAYDQVSSFVRSIA